MYRIAKQALHRRRKAAGDSNQTKEPREISVIGEALTLRWIPFQTVTKRSFAEFQFRNELYITEIKLSLYPLQASVEGTCVYMTEAAACNDNF